MSDAALDNSRNEPASERAPARCPACGGGALTDIYSVENTPTNSCILLRTRAEARAYPTGDIALAFCDDCGFAHNRLFDPAKTEYSGRYEETQSFSATFNRFHEALARRLIDKHRLAGGRALEIGCGKGEFLALLARFGDVEGVGVDPGVHPERLPADLAEKLTFRAEFFRPDHIGRAFDLVACKMTLEHIPEPIRFVETVRAGLSDDSRTVVFFQVPEAMRILDGCAFEDVYYEHCAYFSAGSLARLFRRARFDIVDIAIEYGDQYLTLEARAAPGPTAPHFAAEDDLAALKAAAARFSTGCADLIESWRTRIAEAAQAGRKTVLWGSGSKAVSFLNAVDAEASIGHVTDINPNRHGCFMPATAQEIVPPAALSEIRPDLVIAMNRIYVDEIRRDLQSIGLSPEIAAL